MLVIMLDFKALKKEIKASERPLFFFDDDPDGLSSFLLLYRFLQKGKGIVIKATPRVGREFVSKVNNYNADSAFVLDLHTVDQDFIDGVKAKVVWIDHHSPLVRTNVSYYNPRLYDSSIYYPTSLICYNALKKDIWIAGIGVIGDWLIPPFFNALKKKYPYLVKNYTSIEDLHFKSKIGELIHTFSMILKGPSFKVMQCVKVLTRIDDPLEILEQKTSAGKFIYKNAEYYNRQFLEVMKETKNSYKKNDPLLVFLYSDNQTSFTPDIAKNLLAAHPDKIVIVGREKSGEVKMSFRSKEKQIAEPIKKALKGIDGYGGGHELSCGGNVKKPDFERFLENLRMELKE